MTMIIALASPRVAASAEECLERIERSISEAATRGAEIVCFPEAYLPGLRGLRPSPREPSSIRRLEESERGR